MQLLSEVRVRAFEQKGQGLNTAIVKVITVNGPGNKTSLLQSFNAIPGSRMEERSPGSYRINIRGSSLRSPFGVRNVKIYWNDIPVTDPGGNTYFNQFAANNFSSIEIFKGPASSLYGAGTGGLILMNNDFKRYSGLNLEYIAGAYNLQNVLVDGSWGGERNPTQVTYAHTGSDGYREQSKMRRDNISWTTGLKLSEKQELMGSVLFTDMYYQTPGALTLKEYGANPRASRPAVGSLPSAADARAAIFQKTFLTGISYHHRLSPSFKNSTSIYGAFAQVKNSAIRNFERRNEPHFGGRSLFTFERKWAEDASFQWSGGIEFQKGYFNMQVAKNRGGTPDSIQTNDDINSSLLTVFTQASALLQDWAFSGGISLNNYRLNFTRLSSYPVNPQVFSYYNQLAPRVTILKKFNYDFSLLATVSRGFSPPTVAELLPSTGIINTALQAEWGWNYELTARQFLLKKLFLFEATAFHFDLKNALVQRRDAAGADYFTNSGNIRQKGLELYASYFLLPHHKTWIDYGVFKTGYSLNHFRYGNFIKEGNDFSGKIPPGVPAQTLSLSADLVSVAGWYVNGNYYGSSTIFLNDANTVSAKPYHVLSGRIGWKKPLQKIKLNLYMGADNLLNEQYSLGNDINAAGGRYYNAAAARNFYAGIAIEYRKPAQ